MIFAVCFEEEGISHLDLVVAWKQYPSVEILGIVFATQKRVRVFFQL